MRNLSKKTFTYIAWLFLTCIATILYSQIAEASFGDNNFFVFGFPLGIVGNTIIFSLILLSFILLLVIGYRQNIIGKSNNNIMLTFLIVFMYLYIIFITLFKDNSHYYVNANKPIITNDLSTNLISCYTITLNFLFIYCSYNLIKNYKENKAILNILFSLICTFGYIACIYSLIKEIDVYKDTNLILFLIKERSYASSFYTYGNFFAHTLLISMLSVIALYLINHKWYLLFLIVPLVYFLIFSGSRTCYFLFIVILIEIIIIVLYKMRRRHKLASYICLIVIISLVTLFMFEVFVIKSINFTYNNEKHTLYDCFLIMFKSMVYSRKGIISSLLSLSNPSDLILGLGYGNNYIISRNVIGEYYLHNAVVEYLAIGGLPFLLFIATLIFISLYKAFKIRKINGGMTLFIVLNIVILCLYTITESIGIYMFDFVGGAYALLIVFISNMYYEKYFKEVKTINHYFKLV